MKRHQVLDEEARDRAALYALDALTLEEASEFEAHLETCVLCLQELHSMQTAVSWLGASARPARPPAGMRERLFSRIAARQASGGAEAVATPASSGKDPQIWKRWADEGALSGLSVTLAGAGGWEPTGIAGIEVRRLFVDAESDRVSMLVRMQRGTVYPAHRHAGSEECYVLEGDLSVGTTRLRAGDYQRAAEGSVHEAQSTEGGCVLFIASSLCDELLGPDHS